MAISNNILFLKTSGQIGKQLVIRQREGKTIISSYPDMSKRVLTPKQLRVNEIMAEANYATREILGDEALRNAAQVRLDVPKNKLYTALIKEYFKNNLG